MTHACDPFVFHFIHCVAGVLRHNSHTFGFSVFLASSIAWPIDLDDGPALWLLRVSLNWCLLRHSILFIFTFLLLFLFHSSLRCWRIASQPPRIWFLWLFFASPRPVDLFDGPVLWLWLPFFPSSYPRSGQAGLASRCPQVFSISALIGLSEFPAICYWTLPL